MMILKFFYFVKRYLVLLWLEGISLSFRRQKLRSHVAVEKPKILFVLCGLMGDTVMCTSAITASKKIFPYSEITILGRSYNIALLKGSLNVDHFIESSFIPFSLRGGSDKSVLLNLLKERSFDISIILLGNDFSKLMRDAGIPVRVGVRGTFLSRYNNYLYDIRSPREWGPNDMVNSLRCLGYSIESGSPRLYVDNNIISYDYPTELNGLPEKYIVIHPFGSTKRQWWPLKYVYSLADNIYSVYGVKSILIGGSDTRICDTANDNIIDLRGRSNIQQLKNLLVRSAAVISTDSGPMHLSAALGVPVIGLFRSVRPELSAIYDNLRPLFGVNEICQLSCRWDKCRLEKCAEMDSISVKEIMIKLTPVIEKN